MDDSERIHHGDFETESGVNARCVLSESTASLPPTGILQARERAFSRPLPTFSPLAHWHGLTPSGRNADAYGPHVGRLTRTHLPARSGMATASGFMGMGCQTAGKLLASMEAGIKAVVRKAC